MTNLRISLLAAATLLSVPGLVAADPLAVLSPDASIRVSIEQNPLRYSIEYRGRPVVVKSPIAIAFKGGAAIGGHTTLANSQARSVRDSWTRVYGKRKQVTNHFNEITLELREDSQPPRLFSLVVRAYDDGAAFRYVLPESWGHFALASERTCFHFASDPFVWAVNFGGFHSSQEAPFKRQRLSDLTPGQVYGCPLLAQVEPGIWAALTEADLTDWAGMYFTPLAGETNTVCTALSPHPDDATVSVAADSPHASPWRVILLGTSPGAFIESDLLENLNAPASFDTSWVKPGKSAWDKWWSGGYAPEQTFPIGMNTATMKYFVDLAAEMGWEYQIVDEGWYGDAFKPGTRLTTWEANPATSITNVIPDLDLHGLIDYAKSKGVRIIVWCHWGAVDKEMDVAFPLYEKWGIAGVKIDFMDRDDQYMVNFYERVAKKAAEHHLLIDFHGAYKPTGWHRTYPNVITREGVLGNEYNKWSTNVTPAHTVTIPFTRAMLGGMDFTPGGFRQKSEHDFRAVGGDSPGPFVMGTRVHQLAMLVVYESALQVICDSPYNYHSSPAGTDFLKIVPTTWDDTRVLNGEVGEFITVARRAGRDWYIGCMGGTDARALDLPLSFLGPGEFDAEIWADAYEAADYPDRLMKQHRTVTAADTLKAQLAPAGGYIAVLRAK